MKRTTLNMAGCAAVLLGCALVSIPATATADSTEAEPDTVLLAALSPEQLFLRAASSALQFEHLREPSRRMLVRDHERSLPYLVTQLDTDDARERHALEDILVRIDSPAVVPVMEALVKEARREDTTRGARLAALVLGRLGDPAAVAPLASVHDHREWKVRGAIGGALGRIGTAGSVAPLVALLADENETVRKSAAVGLKRVALNAHDEESPDRDAARALDDDVISALVSTLGDPAYSVRYSSADALASIGEPALAELLESCESGSGLARLMALRAVGGIGSKRAIKQLRKVTEDPDWTVRAHAAMAIGAIGPEGRGRRVLEHLEREDSHPFVVAAAAAALAE